MTNCSNGWRYGIQTLTRSEEGFGYLPIIRNEHGEEIYRGEFKETAEEALQACSARLVKICD